MTPDSRISSRRSVPSRVRSPTPAKTETPSWSSATRRIISMMRTVYRRPHHRRGRSCHPGRTGREVDDLDAGSNMVACRLRVGRRPARSVDLPVVLNRSDVVVSSDSPMTLRRVRARRHRRHGNPSTVWRTTAPRTSPSRRLHATRNERGLLRSAGRLSPVTVIVFAVDDDVDLDRVVDLGQRVRRNSTFHDRSGRSRRRPRLEVVFSGAMVICFSLSRAERFAPPTIS